MERIMGMAMGVVAAAGCAIGGCASGFGGGPARPALINHVVFVKLHDPGESGALIRECDEKLRTIPGVEAYYAGRHVDTGRPTVIADYDVGVFVGFGSREAYAAYVDHPNHTGLVAAWRPRMAWLHVYDVLDETP